MNWWPQWNSYIDSSHLVTVTVLRSFFSFHAWKGLSLAAAKQKVSITFKSNYQYCNWNACQVVNPLKNCESPKTHWKTHRSARARAGKGWQGLWRKNMGSGRFGQIIRLPTPSTTLEWKMGKRNCHVLKQVKTAHLSLRTFTSSTNSSEQHCGARPHQIQWIWVSIPKLGHLAMVALS